VYYAGIRPLDSKGRAIVMEYDVPVQCGGVVVHPGEILFADFDGIVVIPKQAEDEVFQKAQEKVDRESLSRTELLRGRTLKDVYEQYKSL
ncbi:MAG TPA: hypothetical protein VEV15_07570, partial [Flavisolibacter sp.]|nr:hypothetical protein [Flavisolibacter sp.]